MDCVVVETVRNPSSKPESRAVLTRPGTRFGRLVVERRDALGYVVLRCDCGETVALTGKQVQAGKRYQCDSCDTWDRKPLIQKYLGDEAYKKIRPRADSTRRRCEDTSNKSFKDYGGRGILFAYDNIDHYTLHIGILARYCGLDKQVDRIDNDGDYSPDNVRLVSKKENSRNRRVTMTVQGIPLPKIAESNGMNATSREYDSFRSKVRTILSTREPSMEEVVDLVRHYKERSHNPNLVRKSKPTRIMVDNVRLPDFIARLGFKGNRRIYECAKENLRRNPKMTGEDLRDRITVYAIKKDIRVHCVD